MNTVDLKGMGTRIRKRREELNISREQLAEQLDVRQYVMTSNL